MVDKNDSLLREVEEELRADRLRKLWEAYGTYVIGAVVALLAGIVIYQQVDKSQRESREAAGAAYEAARRLLAANKAPEAAAAFAEIVKTGPEGYATLARFQQAAAAIKAEKPADAVAQFDAIAADTASDPILRDVAKLQGAGLRVGTADWQEMSNRLLSLTDEQNAFRATARELLGLAAQKAGKSEDARKLFLQVLGDAKASKASRDRVNGFMQALVQVDLGKASAPDTPQK